VVGLAGVPGPQPAAARTAIPVSKRQRRPRVAIQVGRGPLICKLPVSLPWPGHGVADTRPTCARCYGTGSSGARFPAASPSGPARTGTASNPRWSDGLQLTAGRQTAGTTLAQPVGTDPPGAATGGGDYGRMPGMIMVPSRAPSLRRCDESLYLRQWSCARWPERESV